MLDEQFAERLAAAPKPKEVVEQLFSKARAVSEERFFCAIVDLERTIHNGTSYLVCENTRSWVIQQFAEYFSRVAVSAQDFPDPEDAVYVRRLHMLAYSQFWECLGIQRLLQQLVRVVAGEEYEPRLFLDSPSEKTYNIFKNLRKQAASVGLLLSEFLEAVYSNQIRNAFAHSQFYIDLYIFFMNHDGTKEYSIPTLKLDTWDRLFSITSDFIIEFFTARREAISELSKISPYRFDLPEFLGPHEFSKDERGYWSARGSS